MRGSILGFAGISLWLFGGIFLPMNVLSFYGWPIFILGGLLIIVGLLPYRKLLRLENKPHEVIVTDTEELFFALQGIPTLKIALENIEEMAYLDDDKRYGIGLWIKNPKNKNISLEFSALDLNRYLSECQKDYDCDVFFPYFSKRSFQELEEIYKSLAR